MRRNPDRLEGVRIEVSPHTRAGSGLVVHATAWAGHRFLEVGRVSFEELPDGRLAPVTVWVDPAFRRRGIASAMYRAAEAQGHRLRRSSSQLPDGVALWRGGRFRAAATARDNPVRPERQLLALWRARWPKKAIDAWGSRVTVLGPAAKHPPYDDPAYGTPSHRSADQLLVTDDRTGEKSIRFATQLEHPRTGRPLLDVRKFPRKPWAPFRLPRANPRWRFWLKPAPRATPALRAFNVVSRERDEAVRALEDARRLPISASYMRGDFVEVRCERCYSKAVVEPGGGLRVNHRRPDCLDHGLTLVEIHAKRKRKE